MSHRRSITQQGGGPPAGYMLWLDASDATTVTVVNGKWTAWRDKSANAYVFDQTSLTDAYPGTVTLNGLATMSFLSSAWLGCLTRIFTDSLPGVTVFTVGRAQTAKVLWELNQSTGNIGHYEIAFYLTDAGTNGFVGRFGYAIDAWIADVDPASWYLHTVGSNKLKVYHWKNGVASPTSGTVSIAYWFAWDDLPRIGTDRGGAVNGAGGYVAETLAYPSHLSDSARNAVHAYLAAKWGLTVS